MGGVGHGQLDVEGRALPRLGVEPDGALVHLDDAVADRQAQAGALADALGREERLEDLVAGALGDAAALVAHGDVQAVLLGRLDGAHAHDARAAFHGLHAVLDQVDQDLRDLVAVEVGAQAGGDVDLEAHLVAVAGLERAGGAVHGLSHQVLDVDRLQVHAALPREVEQVADDLLAALGLLRDELQVVVEVVAVGELLPEDVRVEQDRAQRVVELVRDAGGHLAHAGQLLGVDDVAVHVAQVAPGHVELDAHALRLLDHERQAHGLLGHAAVHGDRLGAAGGVPAGAAVELVLGEELVGVREDVADLVLAGRGVALVVAAVGPRQRQSGEAGVVGRRRLGVLAAAGSRPRTRRRGVCAAGRAPRS